MRERQVLLPRLGASLLGALVGWRGFLEGRSLEDTGSDVVAGQERCVRLAMKKRRGSRVKLGLPRRADLLAEALEARVKLGRLLEELSLGQGAVPDLHVVQLTAERAPTAGFVADDERAFDPVLEATVPGDPVHFDTV